MTSSGKVQIIRLEGTEKRLYELVAPLVMNPSVIKTNNGYPFKTDKNYYWYLAFEDGEVTGFVPVKTTDKGALIDNYYIKGDETEVAEALLTDITGDKAITRPLKAVVHKRHTAMFKRLSFAPYEELKKYDKMLYSPKQARNGDETA